MADRLQYLLQSLQDKRNDAKLNEQAAHECGAFAKEWHYHETYEMLDLLLFESAIMDWMNPPDEHQFTRDEWFYIYVALDRLRSDQFSERFPGDYRHTEEIHNRVGEIIDKKKERPANE